MNHKQTALDFFISQKIAIDHALIRFKDLSDNHFNINPESVNWSDVEQLDRYYAILKHLTDIAFNEGEYKITEVCHDQTK